MLFSSDGGGIALSSLGAPVVIGGISIGYSVSWTASSGGDCSALAVSIVIGASRRRVEKGVVLSPEPFQDLTMKII